MQPGQHRETARVLLLDAQNRVFLLQTHFDPDVQLPPRWITPGGGIDPGETVGTPDGRPVQRIAGGASIKSLFA
jgi:hypothetical protein